MVQNEEYLIKPSFDCGTSLSVEKDVVIDCLLHVSENLHVGGSLKVKGHLHVMGDATIDGDVDARIIIIYGSLKIGGNLNSSLTIVRDDITAEEITCNRIYTKKAINCSWLISKEMDVRCRGLNNKILPHGKEYWAAKSKLSEWSDFIKNPKNCWADFKKKANSEKEKVRDIKFDNWLETHQFKNFLDMPTEIARVHFEVPIILREKEVPEKIEENNISDLYRIIKDTVITPYPDFSKNPSYQKLVAQWGSDIRESYKNTDVNLESLKSFVDKSSVDKAIKDQLIKEINAVENIRKLIDNHHKFITDSFMDDGYRLKLVGRLSQIKDNTNIIFDILHLFNNIVSLVNGVAGGIGEIFLTVVSLMKAAGETNPLEAILTNMTAKLAKSFENALIQNGHIADVAVGDYGKLQKINTMIQSNILSWSETQHAEAVAKSSTEYERRLWVTILPIYWWPTFSYFIYDHPKSSKCGNTVYMPIYTECSWGRIDSDQYYIPYWLVCGSGRWWCNGIEDIANRLKEIGVEMGQIIRGDGDWGPPFAYWRQHPCGQDQQPDCVKHS